MVTDHPESQPAQEARLLVPVGAAVPDLASDSAFTCALTAAQVALVRAWAAAGIAPQAVADQASSVFGWDPERRTCTEPAVPPSDLAVQTAGSGTPVIALVAAMRAAAPADVAAWVHRGATSQDIVDTAIMRVTVDVGRTVAERLHATALALEDFARAHSDQPVAARTLTQHAVPTTMGLRARGWSQGLVRAAARLRSALAEAPAQLAGAGGTLAAFVDVASTQGLEQDEALDVAGRLPGLFAREMGLAAPAAPWHTSRWPVTELGDALVQAADALGKFATDVATLSRTEIGELRDSAPGGSSAMPHKQNPAAAVLIRSAAIRAPHLGATLHTCAALANDERPDGAWHAEWPTLQELLRLTLAASTRGAELASGLTMDTDRAAANLALTGAAVLSERLTIRLTPLLGQDVVRELLARASDISDLRDQIADRPELANLDIDALLDVRQATGLAGRLTDTPDT